MEAGQIASCLPSSSLSFCSVFFIATDSRKPSPSLSPLSPPPLCLAKAYSRGPFPMAALPSSPNGDGTLASPPLRLSASSAIDFLTLCQRLKTTKRTGWVNHGLKETESIADHMHRMGIMAIISADLPGINRDRCAKMAVVHDIAEAIVGDITPSDGIPKDEKSRREREAIDEMCRILGGGIAAEEIKELWLEYEMNSSPEANLVKDFDKMAFLNLMLDDEDVMDLSKGHEDDNDVIEPEAELDFDDERFAQVEMILQALEYENAQGKILNDFFESTAGKFQTDTGKAWAAEIISRRNQSLALRDVKSS